MVCHIMFWTVSSEPIDFGINYPYKYNFDIPCSIWIYSLSKVLSMAGISIILHEFPSLYRLLVIKIE